jgi:hypothetical protein
VAAYLIEARPAWLDGHLAEVLEQVLIAGPLAQSAAKRFRLRCLKPIILLLQQRECPPLRLTDEDGGWGCTAAGLAATLVAQCMRP